MSTIAMGKLYFSIGVPFENSFLPRLRDNFPGLEIVDTRKGIELIPAHGAASGAGNDSQGHDHGVFDPHVWLNPRYAKTIALNIRDALVRIDPKHEQVYTQKCDSLFADLDALDRELAGILEPFNGGRFYVFHPAYGYFGEAYGLTQVALEAEGATPGPRQIAGFIDRAKADNVTTLFVQPQFSTQAAETIAEAIGAEVVPLDPLAYDYIENMRDIAHKIAAALEKGALIQPR
jgi:zinc transport system substrate-binding protein